MRHNQQLFQSKWQHLQAPTAQPLPAAPVPAAAALPPLAPKFGLRRVPGQGLRLVRKVLLSLCMIVRNNERTIRAALESIRPWVHEMIVVDTGSTDRTIEIALSLGARIFHFPWCDSFSAARNFSVDQAQGEWIFWMDSDDVIDTVNGRKLRELAERNVPANVMGYFMQVHCPGQDPGDPDSFTDVDHVKMFRNRRELRFEHRIHEQILPAINRLSGETLMTDIFVVHAGYDRSPEGQKRKIERDLKLLHMEFQENPDHPFTLFNLGMTYTDIGQFNEAIAYLYRCLKVSPEANSHVRKAYSFLVQCHKQLGQVQEALTICETGAAKYPTDCELRFHKGELLLRLGRLQEAAATYEDLLAHHDDRYLQSMVAGITGHLTQHNLALVYKEMGNYQRAEALWRQITRDKPGFQPARACLQEMLQR